MSQLLLRFEQSGAQVDDALELHSSDLASALAVADINLSKGAVEIWDGARRLARLVKHRENYATYWEVAP